MGPRLRSAALRSSLAATLGWAAVSGVSAAAATPPAEPFMVAGDVADAPEGFVEMCARDATLCAAGTSAEAVLPPPVHSAPTFSLTLVPTVFPCGGESARRYDIDLSLPFRPTLLRASMMFSEAEPLLATDMLRVSPIDMRCGTLAIFSPILAQQPAPSPVTAMPIVPRTNAPIFTSGAVTGQLLGPVDTSLARPTRKRQRASGMALLRSINASVNHNTVQVSDLDNVGVEEYWQRLPAGRHPAGDCEDMAIEKRIRLVEAGFPADRLFLAVAFHPRFGLHTLLIARLADGDYVLDSLSSSITRWSKTRYLWLRRQSVDDPLTWRRIAPGNTTLVQQGAAAAGLS